VHSVDRIAWDSVPAGQLEPCQACRTPEWIKRHDKAKPASSPLSDPPPRSGRYWVEDGDRWFIGTAAFEPRRRADGSLWAQATYERDGKRFSAHEASKTSNRADEGGRPWRRSCGGFG
jgi:hypothetical protein